MAKKNGGGANPYVGNGTSPIKAPAIKKSGTQSVTITKRGK